MLEINHSSEYTHIAFDECNRSIIIFARHLQILILITLHYLLISSFRAFLPI